MTTKLSGACHTALAQHRREVAAGLRTANDPTDALWSAAWRQLAAQCWRIMDQPERAIERTRLAAQIILSASRKKRLRQPA